MNPKQLKEDTEYKAFMGSGRKSVVRLDKIENQFSPITRKQETRYYVTEISTGKQIVWRNAVKFIEEFIPCYAVPGDN